MRDTLDAGGHWWQMARSGRNELPLVTDVDIGAVALGACNALAAASFTFGWHEEQDIVNRDGWPTTLPGMTA